MTVYKERLRFAKPSQYENLMGRMEYLGAWEEYRLERVNEIFYGQHIWEAFDKQGWEAFDWVNFLERLTLYFPPRLTFTQQDMMDRLGGLHDHEVIRLGRQMITLDEAFVDAEGVKAPRTFYKLWMILPASLKKYCLNWTTRFPLDELGRELAPYVTEIGTRCEPALFPFGQKTGINPWIDTFRKRLEAHFGGRFIALGEALDLLDRTGYGLHPAVANALLWYRDPSDPYSKDSNQAETVLVSTTSPPRSVRLGKTKMRILTILSEGQAPTAVELEDAISQGPRPVIVTFDALKKALGELRKSNHITHNGNGYILTAQGKRLLLERSSDQG